MQQVVCAGGFITKNGKILVVKRAENDSLPGYYELPGGQVDFGENPKTGAAREVREEVGLDVEVKQPLSTMHWISAENIHGVLINYLCEMKDPNQTIQLSEEHSEYKWVEIQDIENMYITDEMKDAIKTAYKHLTNYNDK